LRSAARSTCRAEALAAVTEAMPTDMGALYRSWVDANPGKAGRLGQLVAETVATFREAVAANPACVLNDEPDTVPTAGFRHALNCVIFYLGMELGVQFAPEVYTLTMRADIWLRMVSSGTLNPVKTGDGRTPSYAAPEGERGMLG
jgi:hypothetical protein